MDAHLVRRFCEEAEHLLLHARLEKIQSVQQEMFSFLFYTSLGKQQLCLKPGKQGSFLFLTSHPLSLGLPPSAWVMRLRKYFQGHRVASIVANPFERKIYMLFEGAPKEEKEDAKLTWLLLDLREGPALLSLPAQETPKKETVLWPTKDELNDACTMWRSWPVLTPKLRKTLSVLDPLEGMTIINDLRYGGGPIYLYRDARTATIKGISAWPLPRELRGSLLEETNDEALDLLEQAGQQYVFEPVLQKEAQEEALEKNKQRRKLDRLARRLEEEESRLKEMCAVREKALLIQSRLWNLDKTAKLGSLTLTDADHMQQTILLDPKHTVLENMQQLFHTAERGKRGLVYLEKRKHDLQTARTNLEADGAGMRQDTTNAVTTLPHPSLPANVEYFRSSDGFVLLRGRNARGNLAARKLAQGHDLWLHTVGGPGSHVIIRLAWPGQEVPEQTLQEAGTLAANKSWQKDADSAEIACAEVRHIKPMRGAPQGTVHIDKIRCTRRVPVDPSADKRLQEQTASCGSSKPIQETADGKQCDLYAEQRK